MMMRYTILPIVALIGVVALAGCQTANDDGNNDAEAFPGDSDQMACPMMYDPVCATLDTGLHCTQAPCSTTQQETFSNSCMASISVKPPANILSIEEGACEGDE